MTDRDKYIKKDTHTRTHSQRELSYKAGGVHLLPPNQVSDVVSVVGDSLHAAHKVLSGS